MSEWKETTLGELISIKHGYAFKGDFFSDIPTEYILLTPGNFNIGGGFKDEKIKYYNGGFPEEYILNPGDIIITMTDLSKSGDTLGYSAKIPNRNKNFLHNQRLGLVQIKSDKADSDFIYWLLRTKNYQKTIVNSASGSTVRHTSPSKIQEYIFSLPPIEEQKQIADILSCLDNKIDNLRRQNETLEKIAQTLFKHWFIDFEFPNDEGKPYKSSGGAMVASELGDIPEGWGVGKMQNIIEVRDGTHDSPKQSDKGFKLITSKHLKKEGIDFDSAYLISENDYVEINKRSKVETFDILLSMIGTVGLLYFVQEKVINFGIKNIGLFKTSQNLNYSEYIYLFIKSNYGETYLKTRLAGTTQSYVTLGALRDMPLIVPSSRILSQFKQIAKSIFDKDYFNQQQVQTLTKTRDTLLPKLMSGQIRVKD
jgi:type I restriction enzyme, S subunit